MKNKKKWIERQQAIVDAARAAGRGLTAEEREIILDGCLMNYYAKRAN